MCSCSTIRASELVIEAEEEGMAKEEVVEEKVVEAGEEEAEGAEV